MSQGGLLPGKARLQGAKACLTVSAKDDFLCTKQKGALPEPVSQLTFCCLVGERKWVIWVISWMFYVCVHT